MAGSCKKIRKSDMPSMQKGDSKSRSARDMSLRFRSGRIRSYFCKGMKVRARGESAYISTYGTTDEEQVRPFSKMETQCFEAEQARGITVLMREQ